MKIEITIPILNEEATLERQVKLVLDYLDLHLADSGLISLVLADNGSTDNTQQIALGLSEKNEKVKYIRLEQKGVGRALKASWTQSSADIVGYMDLDLATDLKHLREAFIPLLNQAADIVTGSRLVKGARVIGRSRLRNFTSWSFNQIVQRVFRSSFSDGMCGFKFLKRSILERLMRTGAASDGWFFATELLIVSDYLHYRIVDLPVVWTDCPNSKVKIIKLAIEYLRAIFSLRRKLTMPVVDSTDA